jgi:Siphovirus Gp157
MKDGGRIIVVGSNIVSANWVPWCECLPPTASRKPPTHRQRKSAENKVERTKALVLYYLQSREITKMEGKQFTLRCHKNPQDSVRISDPSLIPLRLKRVEARFDGGTWERIVAAVSEDLRAVLVAGIQDLSPMNDAIKQAVAQREIVKGAIVTRGYHVRVA